MNCSQVHQYVLPSSPSTSAKCHALLCIFRLFSITSLVIACLVSTLPLNFCAWHFHHAQKYPIYGIITLTPAVDFLFSHTSALADHTVPLT